MTSLQFREPGQHVAEAYDALANSYDLLTAGYCHDVWLERIECLALAHGLKGRRVLDVACGTGKSFLPLKDRGYEITACDVSPRMVAMAQRKAVGVPVTVEDMRDLRQLGRFDLVTCLDDAVNYLLTEGELFSFFVGMARNLATNGILVFDVNSLALYRDDFRRDWLLNDASAFIAWSAGASPEPSSGAQVSATIHVFSPAGARWVRSESQHQQKHWPQGHISEIAARASLKIVAVHGQHRGAALDEHFDDLAHTKALYLATHQERR